LVGLGVTFADPDDALPVRRQADGVTALMAAILNSALTDFVGKRCHERDIKSAAKWLFEDGGRSPLTLEDVCDALDVAPDKVRAWAITHVIRRSRRVQR
jgi:hypothetical protein